MKRYWRAGDQVRLPHWLSATTSMTTGTIERAYFSAPGFYDVRVNGCGDVVVLHSDELVLLAEEPPIEELAREWGGY